MERGAFLKQKTTSRKKMLSVVVAAAAVLVGLLAYDREALEALVVSKQPKAASASLSSQSPKNENENAARETSFLNVLPPSDDITASASSSSPAERIIQLGDTVELTAIEIFDGVDGDTLYFDSADHIGFTPPRYIVGKSDVIPAFDATPVGRKDGSVVGVMSSSDHAFGPSGFHPWHVPPLRSLIIYFRPSVVAKAGEAAPSS